MHSKKKTRLQHFFKPGSIQSRDKVVTKALKIGHINIQSSRNKSEEIDIALRSCSPDILSMTEHLLIKVKEEVVNLEKKCKCKYIL